MTIETVLTRNTTEPEFVSLYSILGDKDKEFLRIGVYFAPLPGQYEYDRVQMMVTAGGKRRGWIMTPHEAEMVAHGLMMAVDRAKKEAWYDE